MNFQMLTIDKEEKRLTINYSQKINNLKEPYIQLLGRDGDNIPFSYAIKNKQIIIDLLDYPVYGIEYILRIKNVFNVLDETCPGIRRKIIFPQKREKVEILSPTNMSAVGRIFTLTVSELELVKYHIQISKDNIFANLVIDTYSSNSSNEFSLPDGQYYIRVSVDEDYWSDFISIYIGEKEENEDYSSNAEIDIDITPELDLDEFKITKYPIQGTNCDKLTFFFSNPLNEDQLLDDVYIYNNGNIVEYDYEINGNVLELSFSISPNSTYSIDLYNVESKDMKTVSEQFNWSSKMYPLYTTVYAVRTLISNVDIEDSVILYHIYDASKYVEHLSGENYDESNVPFEIESFVKYRAAHECLLNYLVKSADSVGVSGTVGNVSFSEKETDTDLSDVLNNLKAEEKKWRDEARGFINEGRASMTHAVRGKWRSRFGRPYEPPYINDNYSRGLNDYYGR